MTTTMSASARYSTKSDADLAARFACEVEPLFDVLARGARRLARCDADAEDLLQDALLHAFNGFHTFREGTNLKAWLFRIMYNRWINTYHAKQRRPSEVALDDITDRDLTDGAARLPGGMRSAEAEMLDALPDNDIKAAMQSLPDGFGVAIYYSDIEGYTYAEIATLLNIPLGTVMSRVFRARKRLRIALAHRAPRRNNVSAVESCAA